MTRSHGLNGAELTWRDLLRVYLKIGDIRRLSLALLFFCGALELLISIVVPLAGAAIVDALVKGLRSDFVFWLVILTISTFGRSIVNVGSALLALNLNEHVGMKLRDRAMADAFDHGLRFFENFTVGDVLSRCINDTNALKNGLTSVFVQVLFDALTVVAVFIVLCWMSPVLGVAITASLPLTIAYRRKASEKIQNATMRHRSAVATMTGRAQVWLSRMADIKTYGVEHAAVSRCHNASADLRKTSIAAASIGVVLDALNVVFISIPTLLVFGYGGVLVQRGELTVGHLFAFTTLSGYLFVPTHRLLTALFGSLPALLPTASRVLEIVIDSKVTKDLHQPREAAEGMSLQLRGVAHRFAGANRQAFTIAIASFEVRLGEIVGLVGANGAGKSTLARLLCGAYVPAEGNAGICHPAECTQINVSPSNVHVVPQQPAYLAGSLLENVALFDVAADRGKVEAILHDVGLTGLVSSMAQGIDTTLEPGGLITLSGGELRRIAIARAMYSSAPFVVFDEPFADLDPTMTEHVCRLLRTRFNGRGVVLINHVGSLPLQCDRHYEFTVSADRSGSQLFDSVASGMGNLQIAEGVS